MTFLVEFPDSGLSKPHVLSSKCQDRRGYLSSEGRRLGWDNGPCVDTRFQIRPGARACACLAELGCLQASFTVGAIKISAKLPVGW